SPPRERRRTRRERKRACADRLMRHRMRRARSIARVSTGDSAVIDRLRATGAIASDAAIDATIRPRGKNEAETLAGGRKGTTITGPFLPSITLSESGDEGATPGATSADLLVTTLLGEGGMGVVHMAMQRSLDR